MLADDEHVDLAAEWTALGAAIPGPPPSPAAADDDTELAEAHRGAKVTDLLDAELGSSARSAAGAQLLLAERPAVTCRAARQWALAHTAGRWAQEIPCDAGIAGDNSRWPARKQHGSRGC